jgi:hypothetical protein
MVGTVVLSATMRVQSLIVHGCSIVCCDQDPVGKPDNCKTVRALRELGIERTSGLHTESDSCWRLWSPSPMNAGDGHKTIDSL